MVTAGPSRPAPPLAEQLTVACTLTAEELAAAREGLLPGLLAQARGSVAVPGGFRWRFEARDGLLADVATVMDAEHRCCRFLRLSLVVEPGDGPVWLEATGPPGTAELLAALAAPPSTDPG